MSPSKLNRSISQQQQQQQQHSTPKTLLPSNGGFITPTATTSAVRTPSEKQVAAGPPTMGLLTGNRATPKMPVRSTTGTPLRGAGTFTPMPTTPQLSFGGTPGPATGVREEIFNTSVATSSCQDMGTWITVFGESMFHFSGV